MLYVSRRQPTREHLVDMVSGTSGQGVSPGLSSLVIDLIKKIEPPRRRLMISATILYRFCSAKDYLWTPLESQ
jgi:hypothetical protein